MAVKDFTPLTLWAPVKVTIELRMVSTLAVLFCNTVAISPRVSRVLGALFMRLAMAVDTSLVVATVALLIVFYSGDRFVAAVVHDSGVECTEGDGAGVGCYVAGVCRDVGGVGRNVGRVGCDGAGVGSNVGGVGRDVSGVFVVLVATRPSISDSDASKTTS